MTPSQDLMLEVLTARCRLGEQVWTFEKRHRKTAAQLQELGYVHWKSGIVDNSILVFPTDQFATEYLAREYVGPRYRRLIAAARQVLGRRGHLCKVCLGVSPQWDGHDVNPPCEATAREQLAEALDELS